LNLLRRSELLPFVTRSLVLPLRERLNLHFAKDRETRSLTKGSRIPQWALRAVAVVVLAAIAYAVARVFSILATMSSTELRYIVWAAGATFLRVEAVLLLAALWTVPAGVAIGLRPKLSAIAQPIAQIAASVPATALFPIILLVLIRAGGGLGIGSIVLLLLGTQWYLLFNVIAGATAIPADLKDCFCLPYFPT
jgi:NitT/TauT family transport system permease protein